MLLNFYHFSLSVFKEKIWVIKAEIQKKLVRITNREDADQTASEEADQQSDLGFACLSRPFWLAISV